MQRQKSLITELEPEQITAEQLAILLKENNQLKTSLQQVTEAKQASEKRFSEREAELTRLVQTNAGTTMHWNAVANQKSTSLEQTKEELQRTQELSQRQKEQLELSIAEIKLLNKENKGLQAQLQDQQEQMRATTILVEKTRSQLSSASKRMEAFQFQNDTLSDENENLQAQIDEAKKEAAKTPRWKYVLGASLLISGILLTATGVGAVITVPAAATAMIGLGYAAFGLGTLTLVGSFLYAAYKGLRACCFPSSKQSADQGMDLSATSDSSEEPDSPVYGGPRRTVLPDSPVARSNQHGDDALLESKHDHRARVTGTSHAANRYNLHHHTAAAPVRGSIAPLPLPDGLEHGNKQGKRR